MLIDEYGYFIPCTNYIIKFYFDGMMRAPLILDLFANLYHQIIYTFLLLTLRMFIPYFIVTGLE